MNKDRFYTKDLKAIREFCLNSDKEDVYKYIYSLQRENFKLQARCDRLTNNLNKLKEWLRKGLESDLDPFDKRVLSYVDIKTQEIESRK